MDELDKILIWLDKIFSEIDPNLVDSNQKFGFRTNLEELSLKFQRVRLNLGELDQKFGGVRQNLSFELDAKFRKQNPAYMLSIKDHL